MQTLNVNLGERSIRSICAAIWRIGELLNQAGLQAVAVVTNPPSRIFTSIPSATRSSWRD
jgi:hypothetical protein